MKILLNSFYLALFCALFLSVNSAFAEFSKLPEPMISLGTADVAGNVSEGGTVVTKVIGGVTRIIYGGTGANQVVLNYDPDVNDVGFIKSNLDVCSASLLNNRTLPNVASCFLLKNANQTSMKLMTSKTEYNNYADVLEVSTLFYNPSIIQGDAYGNFDSTNFAFYGRNLNQASGSESPANGSWNVANYSLNPEAQSSFDKDQLAYLKNRVLKLAGEAQSISANILKNTNAWYLQGSTIGSGSNDEADKYPEGKVWIVSGSMNLNRDITYYGKGTIIFLDDPISMLEIGSGYSIFPGDSNTDSLGLIIGGKTSGVINDDGGALDFKGNNRLTAAVLVFGDIDKSGSGSVEAIGSFVANNFTHFSSNGFSHFAYDYKLDQMWPPGFRYFNMPTSKNGSAN